MNIIEKADAAHQHTAALLIFFKWAMREGPWQGYDLDGAAVQNKALALGLVKHEPYDPAKHGECIGGADHESGADFYVFAPGIA